MIRDPSDGTVREAPKAEKLAIGIPIAPDTGIRQPTRTDAQMRLDESRNWLKNYHAKKEREHAARGNDGEERTTDRDSSNDQGQAEPGLSDLDRADHGTPRQG